MESTLSWLAADKPLDRRELVRVGLTEAHADWVMGTKGAGGVARDAERWKDAHPAEWAALKEASDDPKNAFAKGLVSGLHTFGCLTPKQESAMKKMLFMKPKVPK